MPLSKLVFKPGINKDQTNYASEGGWFEMDKVRFRSGYPEKIGGWQVQTFTPYVGTARLIFPWGLTSGNTIYCVATNEKIYATTVLHYTTSHQFVQHIHTHQPLQQTTALRQLLVLLLLQ
jgi:hypothetical protein